MVRFVRRTTRVSGVEVIERIQIGDERGYFSRFFCREELVGFGTDGAIAQINHTLTRKRGAVRGMHFQRAPHDEIKIVSCLVGAIFDVAVDLRPGSPTFLEWHGEVLSAENARSLLIPSGFAHGFQTLEEGCELIYLHDKPHAPGAEDGLNPCDPRLDIAWPLAISQLSSRDSSFPLISL